MQSLDFQSNWNAVRGVSLAAGDVSSRFDTLLDHALMDVFGSANRLESTFAICLETTLFANEIQSKIRRDTRKSMPAGVFGGGGGIRTHKGLAA